MPTIWPICSRDAGSLREVLEARCGRSVKRKRVGAKPACFIKPTVPVEGRRGLPWCVAAV